MSSTAPTYFVIYVCDIHAVENIIFEIVFEYPSQYIKRYVRSAESSRVKFCNVEIQMYTVRQDNMKH